MIQPNAADRKWVREQEKAAKLVDVRNQTVVVALMGSPDGRAYIWDKLATAHIFAATFSTDPLQMAFNEGQRNQGLLLLADITQWCPDQFILAMRESNARRTSNDAARSDTGERGSGSNGDGRDQGSADDAGGDDTRSDHYGFVQSENVGQANNI
jgi:hypothetical protein